MEVDGKKITFKTANEDEVRTILDVIYAPLQWGLVLEDYLAVLKQDPDAVTIAVHEDGQIIGAVVFMKINDRDAGFGGFCMIEEFRKKGVGWAMHNAGLDRVRHMNVTLTAVEDMFSKYKSRDYPVVSKVKGVRYSGPIDKSTIKTSNITVVDYKPEMLQKILDYDKTVMSHNRDNFMKIFLPLVKGSIVVAQKDGKICGYGILRGNTHRLGPVFADDTSIALTMMAALLKNLPDEAEVILDIPDTNPDILELAKKNRMKWIFTLPRLFSKEEVEINWEKVHGLHSVEVLFI